MGYNYRRDFEINEDKTADLLQNAVAKITTEEDIDTLTELIKLFKKNVPLSRRKYVTAYLLKETLKHYHYFGRNNNRNNARNSRNDYKNEFRNDYKAASRAEKVAVEPVETVEPAEERPRHPRVQIDADKATSIFISIGKNRRVYPRDLVGIIIAVAGIDRERIGDIKVLANYSFVQLYTEDAQTAIDKLNGYEYRGRKLAVSYSRQKSDEDNETAEDEIMNAEDTMNEEAMAAEDAAAYAAAEKAAADKTPFGV
ncbi:MAG: DbpA RNA binding domain-containing protein [Treponema sp.]|nr:DbpA RNA binding domain-containing protein [Treponema sp.]